MIYNCPDCKRLLAKEDRRKKVLETVQGTTIDQSPRVAPRFVCQCGKVIIFVKGRL